MQTDSLQSKLFKALSFKHIRIGIKYFTKCKKKMFSKSFSSIWLQLNEKIVLYIIVIYIYNNTIITPRGKQYMFPNSQ